MKKIEQHILARLSEDPIPGRLLSFEILPFDFETEKLFIHIFDALGYDTNKPHNGEKIPMHKVNKKKLKSLLKHLIRYLKKVKAS